MSELISRIVSIYGEILPLIELREGEFALPRAPEELFAELAFCLCTPQSNAHSCSAAVERLRDTGLLTSGGAREIAESIRGGVRFHHTKGERIRAARDFMLGGGAEEFARVIAVDGDFAAREWIYSRINGIGFKEASHFLRNTGHGARLAILDRHILRFLTEAGVIDSIPSSISVKRYLEIEQKMTYFADSVKIPLGHLDFVLWYRLKGEVFK
ncbi:MAG: N-glycosylase/DNA lyase [Brevinematales bacterium]|nr:N-glycosylase/DNA lyase [Brevinematales bacterium]